jgi:superfamily II DNA/RNA helicase
MIRAVARRSLISPWAFQKRLMKSSEKPSIGSLAEERASVPSQPEEPSSLESPTTTQPSIASSNVSPSPSPKVSLEDSKKLRDQLVKDGIGFIALGIPRTISRTLANKFHWHLPTQVQQIALKGAMEGHDLIVSARAGTGKTAIFGLPLLKNVLDRDQSGWHRGQNHAWVVVPTDPLARQIQSFLKRLSGEWTIDLLTGSSVPKVSNEYVFLIITMVLNV